MKTLVSWYQRTPDWLKLAAISQISWGLLFGIAVTVNQSRGEVNFYFFTCFIVLVNTFIPYVFLRLVQYLTLNNSFLVQQVFASIAIVLSAIPLVYWNVFARLLGSYFGLFDIHTQNYAQYAMDDINRELEKGLGFIFFNRYQTEFGFCIAILLGIALVRAAYKTKQFIEANEQAEQVAQLKAQNTRNQLRALQARINPHFLYNALNSIAGLTHEKPDHAEQMAVSLASLFREALNRKEEDLATVAQEIEIIEHYLTVEKIRFGEALQYDIFVDQSVRSAQIPRFLLQPLVENAVKHGIEPEMKGKIVVEIRHQKNTLVISVQDSGKAFPDPISANFGLQNVQDSLELLFPNRHTISFKNATYSEPKQVVVSISS